MAGYRAIFERLLDDVAFLWLQRDQAADHPAYFAWDLAAMDERIHNYLRAMLQAPDISWSLYEEAADTADAGYFFAAAVLAFQTENVTNIKVLIERSAKTQECVLGISSALAYLPGASVHPWIKKLFISKSQHHQHLALLTCHMRREDPRHYLTAIMQQPDIREHEDLLSCAMRLAGIMKRSDLLPMLHKAMEDDRESVKLSAAWSCALLGEKSAAPILHQALLADNEWQKEALASLLSLLDVTSARVLVDELALNEATRKQAIEGCALLGDVSALPWLLQVARTPEFNQAATQAVVTITGIALESEWLSHSNTLMDDDSEWPMDTDENFLPVDPDKLTSAWHQNRNHWEPGQRYFLGQSLQAKNLLNLYKSVNQRHRQTAAWHLAALLPDRPLLDHARKELFRL